jgi:hypothetical protein
MPRNDLQTRFAKAQAADTHLSLLHILLDAFEQSAVGKGKERHGTATRFEDQPIFQIPKLLGGEKFGQGFRLGQALKKLQESTRLPTAEAAYRELLGAIVYIAAEAIEVRKRIEG